MKEIIIKKRLISAKSAEISKTRNNEGQLVVTTTEANGETKAYFVFYNHNEGSKFRNRVYELLDNEKSNNRRLSLNAKSKGTRRVVILNPVDMVVADTEYDTLDGEKKTRTVFLTADILRVEERNISEEAQSEYAAEVAALKSQTITAPKKSSTKKSSK